MAADSATFVSQLNEAWPVKDVDPVSDADGQIITIKRAVKNSFPNIGAAVTVTPAEMNTAKDLSADCQTQLDTISASAQGIATNTNASLATLSAGIGAQLDSLSSSIDAQLRTMSATLDTKIEDLSATLNASKLDLSATAADTLAWGESHQFFQTATPAGAVEGDLWFQLEGS